MKNKTTWFQRNAIAISADLIWLQELIDLRIAALMSSADDHVEFTMVAPPKLPEEDLPYPDLIRSMEMSGEERLVLLLVLAPHLQPGLLDALLQGYPDKRAISEFGGYRGQSHQGFLPTIETALFILAGDNLAARLIYNRIFSSDHYFAKNNWIRVQQSGSTEPFSSSAIVATSEIVSYLTTGEMGEPEFGPSFPAQKIETNREWDDLVLQKDTLADLHEIIDWIQHEKTVMQTWGLKHKVSPGFRALFYGPPGTGKTFTASLLGKVTGREVYRIDLSMVVSKYIGETEKNLKVVFDKAQSRDWILFFDEADALFGKRTDVSDSKDRYANQEVSYLLQRVENFDGIVILATNNRDNMDKAFTRRFQAVINFPIPNSNERLRLWETGFPDTCGLAPDLNLLSISDRYELTGGSIMNVVRHCALRAAVRGIPQVEEADMLDGIRREIRKSGRIMY